MRDYWRLKMLWESRIKDWILSCVILLVVFDRHWCLGAAVLIKKIQDLGIHVPSCFLISQRTWHLAATLFQTVLWPYYKIYHVKYVIHWRLEYSTVGHPSPHANVFITCPQKPTPLWASPTPPSHPILPSAESACLYRIGFFRHFMQTGSCSMTGLSLLPQCFPDSSVLQQVSAVHRCFASILRGHTTLCWSIYTWWTFGLVPYFAYCKQCYKLLFTHVQVFVGCNTPSVYT